MAAPEFFNLSADQQAETYAKAAALESDLDAFMQAWEQLETEMEQDV